MDPNVNNAIASLFATAARESREMTFYVYFPIHAVWRAVLESTYKDLLQQTINAKEYNGYRYYTMPTNSRN